MATAEALVPVVTDAQLELVRKTVANGATADELKLYLYDCQRQGVHPLDRLLHFTKRGGKYTPVTSIDLMRIRAAETEEMAGSEDAVFDEGEGQHPIAATVTVYRLTQGQRFAYTATAYWSEYFPGEQSGHMWKKMPHTMLAKCAEGLALRKGFPRQLAGLYAKEELDQAGESNGYTVTAPSVPLAIPPAAGKDVPAASTGDIAASIPTRAPLVSHRAILPAGVVLIEKVEPGPRGSRAKGFLRTSTMRADEDGLALYDDRLKGQAEQFCQDGVPVVLEIATPASGKNYVKAITVAETGESHDDDDNGLTAEMLKDSDIAF